MGQVVFRACSSWTIRLYSSFISARFACQCLPCCYPRPSLFRQLHSPTRTYRFCVPGTSLPSGQTLIVSAVTPGYLPLHPFLYAVGAGELELAFDLESTTFRTYRSQPTSSALCEFSLATHMTKVSAARSGGAVTRSSSLPSRAKGQGVVYMLRLRVADQWKMIV